MNFAEEPRSVGPGTGDDPTNEQQSLPACFERRVLLHPRRIALGSGDWQPTYEELNDAANRLTRRLLAHGGAPGDRIALLMRHGAPLIVAVLSVLKASRAVVVLNPTDPPERLDRVLADAEPHLILTDAAHRQLAEQIFEGPGGVLVVKDVAADQPASLADMPISAAAAAFLVYTSGSTGRPKGVVQTHGNIRHHVRRLTQGLELRPEDRIALLASLSGGQGVGTLWCALLNGAAVCPFPIAERGVADLANWLVGHRITVYVSSASLFRHFMKTLPAEQRFPDVRVVRLASEPATADDLAYRRHFADGCAFFHTLSSSETGNIAQMRLTGNDCIVDGRLPVGQPAEGIEVLLLDDRGQEVAPGAIGEIVVRSRYLSPGYWRNPALTAERFSEAADGCRIFRSGDCGRRAADGTLWVTGRKDARVKVRGYRIELSEVEEALLRQPEVEGAVVYGRARQDQETQLVAYVTLRAGRTCTAPALRDALKASLPAYMMPATFVILDEFPLTPHGKIDRARLRQLSLPAAPAAAVPPETEIEKVLADIWKQAFDARAIGRHDDFFDLGGDSLLAMVVAARVQAALNVELDLRAFAAHPTLAALAATIDELRRVRAGRLRPLVRVARAVPLPLSYAQERIWKYSQTPEGMAGYTAARYYRIRGPLDVEALRASMSFMARRHEILRTAFAEVNGKPVQIVQPPQPVPLPLVDLAGAADAAAQAMQFFRSESGRSFDLQRAPLMRFALVRIHPNEHWLLRVNHYLVSDAWSAKLYFRELGLVYEARLRGDAPPVREFEPLQYADYAAWQRRVLHPKQPAYQKAVAWWKAYFSNNPPALELPFRRPEAVMGIEPSEGYISCRLDPQVSTRLDLLGREERATYFAVRLAAFAALLADETGRPDVVLGTHVSNRSRVEVQNLHGFFVNLATLRLRCDATCTFRKWLSRVQRIASEIQARSEIPYEQLCEELRKQDMVPPEIRAIFSVSDHTAPVCLGDAELIWLERRVESMPWGFSLTLDLCNESAYCRAAFDARIYDPHGVRHLLDRFQRFLEIVSGAADVQLTELLARSADPGSQSGTRAA
jgi:amino acid adenylation domain-containing protein